ncbi:hypothetical protein PUNSTDRAFT_116862 [Punctularia strigosozonata HHB-11173 SS5]|uniref:Uncharacterized protein n=1 Tax=Punctularia strigosozonata (strain HHB-11173) TaxID=741275 RepID=R7S0J8_PUNST|nr:uncharacterized protein PUNSTDRAFT_116862 [Punctularia strigosozonata HHB-11173 SS5]EIN03728.1 hypothetical protein PUNSTDRAFT_116862 [Punctularia strigosozonata HHB-11173 SS5]
MVGGIVGGIAGALIGAALLTACALFCLRRRRLAEQKRLVDAERRPQPFVRMHLVEDMLANSTTHAHTSPSSQAGTRTAASPSRTSMSTTQWSAPTSVPFAAERATEPQAPVQVLPKPEWDPTTGVPTSQHPDPRRPLPMPIVPPPPPNQAEATAQRNHYPRTPSLFGTVTATTTDEHVMRPPSYQAPPPQYMSGPPRAAPGLKR